VNMHDQASENIAALDIAIIGIGLRFPGANDAQSFWINLRDGIESICSLSDDDLIHANPRYRKQPNFVRKGAVIAGIERFDAEFFGYTSREAETMDPQHRIFLECAWEAFEDAGCAAQTFQGSVGVYAGCGINSYLINNVNPNRGFFPNRTFLESVYDFQQLVANESDHLSTRVSYKLNLTGPSISLQTACSTSLVAVHLACQALLMGDCDMALAGGSSICVPQGAGYLAEEGMVTSPDGHTRAFDVKGRGTLFGSGVGAILLKPLPAAMADRDAIYAVIKGSAINNDGASKVGFTAPSVEGQAAVIRRALDSAGVSSETISYVEAHGTATPLGDPVEVAALTKSFGTARRNFCALGSVKTNVGHLARTAGMAGLIKTVLALHHKKLPPSLHFEVPNPMVDFVNSPFYVNTALKDWPDQYAPRRAGVSSFGMGGTNAHVVLEQAPELAEPQRPIALPWHILTLSAKDPKALSDLQQRYVRFLDQHPHVPVADICFTANTGRCHFPSRLAVVGNTSKMLRDELSAPAVASTITPERGERETSIKIAFLFSGQGVQYEGMGWQLYRTHPVFQRTLQQCDEILTSYWSASLLDILNPQGSARELMHDFAYTQGVLFSLQYALARSWMSWGVRPDVLMGHSAGEYVAAVIAGVFSLEDGLRLAAERGRLFATRVSPQGRMVAVRASEAQVKRWLVGYESQIAIAAVNGSTDTVISGYDQSISALCERLKREGIVTRVLPMPRACHSPLTEPILSEFYEVAKRIEFSPPRIPFVSNASGGLVGAEIASPEYWCRHLRNTVRFSDGMEVLSQQGVNVFIEMGPDPVLLGMGAACLPEEGRLWLPSLRRPRFDGKGSHEQWRCLIGSLARLYTRGYDVNWSSFQPDCTFTKVHLPTYPFQRRRHWIDTKPDTSVLVQSINLSANGGEETVDNLSDPTTLPYDAGARNDSVVTSPTEPLGEKIQKAPPVRRHEMIRECVRAELMRVIGSLQDGTNLDELDEDRSFLEYGVDSLAALELRSRIQLVIGRPLPTAIVFKYPSLSSMTSYLDQLLSQPAALVGRT
jgi:phthiocerol/phenolphthiocerol synthesis type-I polyketide synthase E